MNIFQELAAPFPQEAVHWRAQSVTKDGDKAMALAYIDARDVQDRLDDVCTPAGWRNTLVETPKGRVISTIEIKIGDEWIGKTDGAGETDVEGDKGAISDALKRAAVLWGIGRYLYDLKSPWVPCESYEKNGKRHWKRWTANPWDFVRGHPRPDPTPPANDAPVTILTLAQAAGVTIQTICESYNVASLDELNTTQAEKVTKRLQATIKDKQKENA